jgi:hypothetical protein
MKALLLMLRESFRKSGPGTKAIFLFIVLSAMKYVGVM